VLVEAIESDALPHSLTAHRHTLLQLGDAYEQLNASFGQFGLDLLTASTSALKSTDETKYESIETSIANLTAQRDSLAGQIKAALDAAAFDDQALDEQQAKEWIARARSLLDQAQQLAGGGQSGSGN
jgi:DNA repair ATPase RecN